MQFGKPLRAACCSAALVLLSGCATLFASGPQSITVNSEPAGAKFQYGPFTGTTPAAIEVPRKALANFATFSKDGYENTTVPVVTGIQGATWWDILFPIGFVIDFVTGNANEVQTPTITATLEAKAAGAAPSAGGIPATTLGEPSTSLPRGGSAAR